ncbi:MAG: 2'-5' RNA ligase family protein [Caldilineaceae bacterium]|nr:2'-5' RNA ligase family protein [Caldilineaceae bacterium]
MTLCVVAYPEVNAAAVAWIQTIRWEFDPQYDSIDPHFTLIFPTDCVDPARLEAHLRAAAEGIAPFRFMLRCALPVKDGFSAQTHLFLVPDEGFSDLVRLHSRLYTGPLKAHLRLDIPYIPHITIGAFLDAAACKAAADNLNAQPFAVEGRIARLCLLDVTPSSVTTRADIELGNRSDET